MTKALIIGGGVAGPALALFLADIGVTAEVYEAYPYTKDVGGGLNIAPNGMQVLAALGLADQLAAAAATTPVFYFADASGRSLGTIPYGVVETYGQPAVSMSRALLYEALADRMRTRGVRAEYGKRLVGVDETPTGVVARFADGTTATGDMLVGADGAKSVVRQHLLPGGPHAEYIGMVGIGGFTPREKVPAIAEREIDALTYTFGTNFFGYGGADKGMVMWWTNLWRGHEYTGEELATLDEGALKQELLAQFDGFHEPIAQLITHSDRTIRHNVYDLLTLPTWHSDRIMLIGDAAHAVSPNSGQGASMALEDAMLLARLLRDTPATAFADFERARRPRVEEIVAEGRRRGSQKKTISKFQAAIRAQIMKVILRRAAKKAAAKPDHWLSYRIDW
jgi:2-polyprenyl-6-methoxyphenol hydroxylase-like FAD-dependent oxidoreductase